ncbi:MAG: nitrile hydratase accessory protein [Alphaproteobacteria bacterium]|nr:nitrile hydratase accessory protein [Alphaproteobacteria bacterium]
MTRLDALVHLPRNEEGPVFREPWEASAFAMAVKLSEEGHFTWKEWAAVLAEEIEAAQRDGDPDLGDTYYRHWLRALERLVAEKELATEAELVTRKQEWVEAVAATPHGQPIALQPKGKQP